MDTLKELRERVKQAEKAIRDDFDRQAIARAADTAKNAPQTQGTQAGDDLLARMQTPEARRGMELAFNASPEELGKAAVQIKKSNGKKRQCPSLYLILRMGPMGLEGSEITFSVKKPNPREITKGVGQCLVFKLNNYDCATFFTDDLFNGRFSEQLKNRIFKFGFSEGLK